MRKILRRTVLYTREELDAQALEELNKNLNSLDEIDSELCEQPLTEAEWLKAIKEMQPGKSPGLDGLPAEFYQLFSL
jgi:hypothetical protein